MSDLGVLELELVLADAATVDSQIDKRRKAARSDKSLAGEVAALERAQVELEAGTPVYRSTLPADDRALLKPFFLLTNKPVLAVVNLGRGPGDRRRVDRQAGCGRARRRTATCSG